jgi:plasmid stabilization system protein ParE
VTLQWSDRALVDLGRIEAFLAAVNQPTAIATLRALDAATMRLLEYPRLGERMDEFADRDVRRIIVGSYEVRYEILASAIVIVRVLHIRQRR